MVCGKKAVGKTAILEQLIFNNSINVGSVGSNVIANRFAGSQGLTERYFSTIEDIYVACWEKDKGIKEKLRFYDTKGVENSKDAETINQMRHLFPSLDGAVLVFSSYDSDSIACIEKLKQEIEKSKDKKEICHFILIDNSSMNPVTVNAMSNGDISTSSSRESSRTDLQSRLRAQCYEFVSFDKRDALCKPFIDLASNITQITNKGSMNIVQSIKKPKVFSSNK